jgi:hypothetical protein
MSKSKSQQANLKSTENVLMMKLRVSDASGQKMVEVPELENDITVGELIEGLLPVMKLPQNDAGGRPLVYHARLEREGRHLHVSELVGDALAPGDRLTLLPNIDAGTSVAEASSSPTSLVARRED